MSTTKADHIELATRWLWRKLDEGKTLPLKPLPLKVVYHTPCHMEKMGWTLSPWSCVKCRGLVDSAGFPVLRYCGYLRFQKRELPHLTSHRCATVPPDKESGADLVITDCETCKWQIEMSTSLRCEHPITLLAQALA